MTCAKCPFFDACRCKTLGTGFSNGECMLAGPTDKYTCKDHTLNGGSKCNIDPEVREEAMAFLLKKSMWEIDSIYHQLAHMCTAIQHAASLEPESVSFTRLAKSTLLIQEVVEQHKKWRR